MQSDEQLPQDNRKRPRPRFRWEFFYYERVGREYHLRITPFSVIFLVVMMIIGCSIAYFGDRSWRKNQGANITTRPTPAQSPMRNTITPTPLPKTKTTRNN